MEEEGGLGRVDGEGDEVAHQADDVPLVPQAGHDSGGMEGVGSVLSYLKLNNRKTV